MGSCRSSSIARPRASSARARRATPDSGGSTRCASCSGSRGRPMRIGTRGSALALAQSEHVRDRLPGGARDHRLVVIKTAGDLNPAASLARIGGKGVFTKEIEEALLRDEIDLAVHSLKDLPTEERPGLKLGALLT